MKYERKNRTSDDTWLKLWGVDVSPWKDVADPEPIPFSLFSPFTSLFNADSIWATCKEIQSIEISFPNINADCGPELFRDVFLMLPFRRNVQVVKMIKRVQNLI